MSAESRRHAPCPCGCLRGSLSRVWGTWPRPALGRAPYRVPAAGKPGDVAMMTSPDAWPLALRLIDHDLELFNRENPVAARIALQMPFYFEEVVRAQIDFLGRAVGGASASE